MLPYEVELGLMARKFGVSPSQIEDEEDALLFCASEGMTILEALAARDRFLITRVHSSATPGQWKLVQMVEEAMDDEGEPTYVEDFNEQELADMGIKMGE